MDYSLPGSSIHGIFQVRVLERVAFPSPEDLPDPGIEPRTPAWQADALPPEPPGELMYHLMGSVKKVRSVQFAKLTSYIPF